MHSSSPCRQTVEGRAGRGSKRLSRLFSWRVAQARAAASRTEQCRHAPAARWTPALPRCAAARGTASCAPPHGTCGTVQLRWGRSGGAACDATRHAGSPCSSGGWISLSHHQLVRSSASPNPHPTAPRPNPTPAHLAERPANSAMSLTRRCTPVPLNVSDAPSTWGRGGSKRVGRTACGAPCRHRAPRPGALARLAPGGARARPPEQRLRNCITATGAMSSKSSMTRRPAAAGRGDAS